MAGTSAAATGAASAAAGAGAGAAGGAEYEDDGREYYHEDEDLMDGEDDPRFSLDHKGPLDWATQALRRQEQGWVFPSAGESPAMQLRPYVMYASRGSAWSASRAILARVFCMSRRF